MAAVRDVGPPPAGRELHHLGHRGSYDVVEDLVKRLGRDAGLPEELRHAHALRHTFATRYYRRTRDLAGLQRLVGHVDPKTTMVYVSEDPAENKRMMLLASEEPSQLDRDRDRDREAA